MLDERKHTHLSPVSCPTHFSYEDLHLNRERL